MPLILPRVVERTLNAMSKMILGNDYCDNEIGDLSRILGVEPMKLTSPSTDAEVALALRVLEGCCLLHPQNTALAHQHNAIQVG
jgi:hypothetical protein